MRRGLKLGLGIPLVVLGFFMTIGGIALVVLVGPDGRFSLPETRASGDGHALVFDAIAIRGDLPQTGSLSTTLDLDVHADREVFVGIGPTADVQTYLSGVTVDKVVQVNWPGGVRTEAVNGTRTPAPPDTRSFWSASDQGNDAKIEWTVSGGDWTIVVMNADASANVDVTGSLSVSLPFLGPTSIVVLVLGLAMLAGGIVLTISGARMPKPARPGTGAAAGAGSMTDGSPPPPPRPDRT